MHTRTLNRPHWQNPRHNPGYLVAPPAPPPTLCERMAAVMRDQNAETGCTEASLLEAGFTAEEIAETGPKARLLARGLFMRDDRPAYDRQQRLDRARRLIADLCPSRMVIVTTLQATGFAKHEIDDLLEDAITLAADDFGDLAVHQ